MAKVAERISKVIRKRLVEQVSAVDGRIGVALSGGVDSCAVLAACMEAGKDVVVVSYTPDTHESTDFVMARETAQRCGVEFHPALFDMYPDSLDLSVREVIGFGYKKKVQVESLVPMLTIADEAKRINCDVLMTGDQSDGFFCLSKWAAHNYDRANGVPYHLRSRNVKDDTTSERIDGIRSRYWALDLSCSGAVVEIIQSRGMSALVPFRDVAIAKSFKGTLWSEVNEPRIKEPIRLAFRDWFEDLILVRPVQVNLHKGDSLFGDTLAQSMMELYPGYATPTGLYAAIARGEV